MRYLVTGSREWGDWRACEAFCRALIPGDIVAHGWARGLDGMIHDLLTNDRNRQRGTWRAKRVVVHGDKTLGQQRRGRLNSKGDIEVHTYPAQWDRFRPEDPEAKNPAGVIRNREMLNGFLPDRCVFFSDDVQVETDPIMEVLDREGWDAPRSQTVTYPEGSGTGDMVKRCIDAGVLVYHWEEFIEIAKGEPE